MKYRKRVRGDALNIGTKISRFDFGAHAGMMAGYTKLLNNRSQLNITNTVLGLFFILFYFIIIIIIIIIILYVCGTYRMRASSMGPLKWPSILIKISFNIEGIRP